MIWTVGMNHCLSATYHTFFSTPPSRFFIAIELFIQSTLFTFENTCSVSPESTSNSITIMLSASGTVDYSENISSLICQTCRCQANPLLHSFLQLEAPTEFRTRREKGKSWTSNTIIGKRQKELYLIHSDNLRHGMYERFNYPCPPSHLRFQSGCGQ